MKQKLAFAARHVLLLLLMPTVWAADLAPSEPVAKDLAACTVKAPASGNEKTSMAECQTPQAPLQFAEPPSLGVRSLDRTAPADMPGLGYHCHWIAPGQKYCHGGID